MKRAARKVPCATLKWLLLCFPYGLYLMWRENCRWNVLLKAGVTALIAAAALFVVFYPSPERAEGTKVELVGLKPETEVFGPALPKDYDPASYYVSTEDDVLQAEATADDTVYVYASASEGSTYYHTATCKYAYASGRRMTLYEAYMLGYRTPCKLCNPPVYDPIGN
jgi:hypothetical protein